MANQDVLRNLVKEEVKRRMKEIIRPGVKAKLEERKFSLDFAVDDAMKKLADKFKHKLSAVGLGSKFSHLIKTGVYDAAERGQYKELVEDAKRLAQPIIEELQKSLTQAIAEGADEAIQEVIDEILRGK